MRMRLLIVIVALISAASGMLLVFHPGNAKVMATPGQPSSYVTSEATWHLAFNAQFSGTELNTFIWATCYPWISSPSGCTNYGNNEYEWYLPSQAQVYGGALHLVANPIPTKGKTPRGESKNYPCRSGMVTSYPSFQFEYGLVQIVARIPSTPGLWSGIWLAAANLKWLPEIDILELWGPPHSSTGLYFHPASGPQVSVRPTTGDLSTGWHTFTLYWSPSRLTWFIDGRAGLSIDQRIPHQKMYFIADLAIYRHPMTNACRGDLLIRSVKVWQQRET
jgi:beta-glucanase (GH16 family)